MKNKLLLIAFLVFAFISCQNQNIEPEVQFYVPKNFPQPVYDLSKNPVTTAVFALGKALFYDGILSRDGTISCGSCHQQQSGFTQHGHDLSHGIDDLLTLRNSLPIQNLAWQKEFFWDGGVFDLDLFAVSPIEAHNEMDETLPNVLNKLRNHAKYPSMFEKAFGTKEISTERFLKALSQFQLMCISANSNYDKYVRNEGVMLSTEELTGLQLFKQKCATCHSGELFSDFSYRNNGLPVGNPEDTGRERITLNEQDKYKFRVPSLRNVEATRPYMHDGRFRSLEAVLDHYEKGIVQSPTLDSQLKNGIALSTDEKQKIIAFLKTLTDEEFMNNRLLSEF
ncbi:cytochrome-c peroxidase [Thermoflexibacter ruber]|uniref:Cytochrome c peroxidase n=1 Tax=Thermoflexibacter ruber TaxID=1003 RepID=A0A1I2BTK0_9BACT|nr:cytochrome c peroxidase [Thermoflexibacter ruber]SFE58703.1 cytochrome c peroxidase [Thermoflexibacter ruber]